MRGTPARGDREVRYKQEHMSLAYVFVPLIVRPLLLRRVLWMGQQVGSGNSRPTITSATFQVAPDPLMGDPKGLTVNQRLLILGTRQEKDIRGIRGPG